MENSVKPQPQIQDKGCRIIQTGAHLQPIATLLVFQPRTWAVLEQEHEAAKLNGTSVYHRQGGEDENKTSKNLMYLQRSMLMDLDIRSHLIL